jgi:putative membrane protein
MVFRLIPSGPSPTLETNAVPGMKEEAMFGSGWCGGMGAGGWLLMALLWGSFLAVVVWAVTRLFPGGRSRHDEPGAPGGGGEQAGSLLDRRLAAGEIDEDTYLRLRGELTSTG